VLENSLTIPQSADEKEPTIKRQATPGRASKVPLHAFNAIKQTRLYQAIGIASVKVNSVARAKYTDYLARKIKQP
jgi:hypothetical protein